MDSPSSRRRLIFRLRIWLGLLLGIGMLYLVLQGIDFPQLRQVLQGIRWPLVLLTLLTSLLTPVLKAVRWRWLFLERPRLTILQLASLIVIGQAINFLIPGRWGELVRAYLTGEEGDISKAYVLGTLAAEKLLDLVILAVLVVALIPMVALPAGFAERVGSVVALALVVAVAAAVLLGGRGLWLRLADWGLRWLPTAMALRWRTRIVAGLDGLGALSRPAAAMAVWGWSLIFWLVAALTNLLLLLAFDLPPSPLMALLLLAVLQAGIAVPSTPGKIGVFHYLCILTLSVFHVPTSVEFAYGLVLYVLVVGGICVWAAIALWRQSWSLRRLAATSVEWL